MTLVRTSTRVWLSGGVLLASSLVAGSVALALNPDTAVVGQVGTCPDQQGQIDYSFQGPDWTPALTEAVDDGFAAWTTVENYKGTGPLVSKNAAGRHFAIRWAPLGGTLQGETYCSPITGWSIVLNSSLRPAFLTNPEALAGLAAHEFGHALGVQHVGKSDGYWGRPTMTSGCMLNPQEEADRRTLDADDAGALVSGVNGEDVGGFESWTPNSSFEHPARSGFPNGFEWWQKWPSTAQWSIGSGGVDGSAQHAVLGNVLGADTYIAQHAYLRVGKSKDRKVKGRVNVRKTRSTDTGTVTMHVMWREDMYYYDVTSGACNELEYLSVPGQWSTVSVVCYPLSAVSFNWCTTPEVLLENVPAGNGRYRVMIFAQNDMLDGRFGDPVGQDVELDRTRMMVKTLSTWES